MIYKKGKWTASYRDTFSLDHTLSPIIYAGLKRFHSVLEQKNREGKCLGVPSEYCAKPEEDVTDEELQYWLDDIKKMMYAFENKEPDPKDYNYTLDFVEVDEETHAIKTERYGKLFTIETSNQAETDRYDADRKIHEEKVQEGLKLTFEKWQSLWW